MSEQFSEMQALQDMQDAQIGRSRAIQAKAGLAALNEPFCTMPDHAALTSRLEAAEAENATLRETLALAELRCEFFSGQISGAEFVRRKEVLTNPTATEGTTEESIVVPHCHAGSDGDCSWEGCPQLVDYQTWCPLATRYEEGRAGG